jgi:hypothetical protein
MVPDKSPTVANGRKKSLSSQGKNPHPLRPQRLHPLRFHLIPSTSPHPVGPTHTDPPPPSPHHLGSLPEFTATASSVPAHCLPPRADRSFLLEMCLRPPRELQAGAAQLSSLARSYSPKRCRRGVHLQFTFISNLRYLSPLFSRRSKRIISSDEVGSQPCRCCWAMGRRPSHHCTRASPLFLLTQITAGAGCESLPLPSRFADPMRQCLTLALQVKKLEKALHLVLEGTLLCAASHSPKFSGAPYSIWQIFRRKIFLLL